MKFASFLGSNNWVLAECHVLLAAIELVAPKPELRACWQDEQTEAASVEHLVFLILRLSVSISLIVSAMVRLQTSGNPFPNLGRSCPKLFPKKWVAAVARFRTPSHLISV